MHHRTSTDSRARSTGSRSQHGPGLPPIGSWWTLLDRGLQREILANPADPLRPFVVRRVFEICGLAVDAVPARAVRLGANERAYISGWAHAVDRT